MKLSSIILFAFLLVACANESAPEQAKANATAPAAKTPQAKQKIVEPEVSTRPVNQRTPDQAAGFSITPSSKTAKSGSEVCTPVQVSNFNDIMSMQYSMQWDAELLSFTKVQAFNLPYMSKQNFGAHKAQTGSLTFLWINNALKGNTLTNGSTIYELCFEVKGKAGQSATIQVTNKPTAIEALNASEKLVQLNPGKGTITIQ